MNLDRVSGLALVQALVERAGNRTDLELAVCPPFVYLEAMAAALAGSQIGLGAQNMSSEAKGAFTGEVSAAMLKDVGCRYVILGHSERRQLFHETDSDVNKKLLAALAAGLIPIVCVGEVLAQRQAGQTLNVIRAQFEG
ncbi:MAG TPA: triose-phosphate isomerase, partial [Pirellulales bacterium]|nr:triose-phosphate isomerase [Pirellulales bacterium]